MGWTCRSVGVLDDAQRNKKPANHEQLKIDYITKQSSGFHLAAVGVQFILVFAIMYVHIGNLGEWMAPSLQEKINITSNHQSLIVIL